MEFLAIILELLLQLVLEPPEDDVGLVLHPFLAGNYQQQNCDYSLHHHYSHYRDQILHHYSLDHHCHDSDDLVHHKQMEAVVEVEMEVGVLENVEALIPLQVVDWVLVALKQHGSQVVEHFSTIVLMPKRYTNNKINSSIQALRSFVDKSS